MQKVFFFPAYILQGPGRAQKVVVSGVVVVVVAVVVIVVVVIVVRYLLEPAKNKT